MKKIKYTNAPKDIAEAISLADPIEDFLPRPDKLVFKEEAVKNALFPKPLSCGVIKTIPLAV